MDKAIWQTYAKKDITPDLADFRGMEYPTMNDLVEILNGMVGRKIWPAADQIHRRDIWRPFKPAD